MKLYVSGEMTGIAEHNFPAFNAAAKALRASGYEVENPADKGLIDGWSWADYLRYDLARLVECDGVALLWGYHRSRGARLEVAVADGLGMPRQFAADWLEVRQPRRIGA